MIKYPGYLLYSHICLLQCMQEIVNKTKEVIQNPETALEEIKSQLGGSWKKPILISLAAIAVILIMIPVSTYLYFIRDISSKQGIMSVKNGGVTLLDRTGKTFFTFYEVRTNDTVSLDQISQYVPKAAVASEDKDFYKNPGFSIEGIGRAIVDDLKNQSLSQGGSTITQQLVKNALLTQSKSFLRKYQELILAIEVDRRFSKNDILEMYLNTVYFGEGAFGIEDASQAYFSKDASDLDLAESALLVGVLPAPSAYSPISGSRELAFQRQHTVLQKMYDQGYITQDQMKQAEAEQIVFHPKKQAINEEAPHFALMVKDQLIKQYGSEQELAHSGLTVTTTLDLAGQEYAQQVVENQVQHLAGDHVSNGAAVVMDPTNGEILALVGSHDWYDEQNGKINMALSPRQPGSSFKPIIYTKALEDHLITPATILNDSKTVFPGGYTPHDYDMQYRGPVTARFALANSLNIPAVEVMQKVGVSDGVNFAEQLGVTTLKDPSNYGLSLVLGAANIPLVEMTEAYAAFANQGNQVPYTTILEIQDKKGNVVYSYTPQSSQVVSPQAAFLISSILSDNKARSYEFGNTLTISRPAAVKTGTTEDFRDALTLGYTPQLVVGAWVGNNDNSPMDSVAGSLGAAPIWRQLMEHFLIGKPVVTFTPPPGITQETVCGTTTFSKDNQASSSAYMEFFMAGTAPEPCATPTPSLSPTPGGSETPTPTPSSTEVQPTPTSTPTPTVPEPTVSPNQSIIIPPRFNQPTPNM